MKNKSLLKQELSNYDAFINAYFPKSTIKNIQEFSNLAEIIFENLEFISIYRQSFNHSIEIELFNKIEYNLIRYLALLPHFDFDLFSFINRNIAETLLRLSIVTNENSAECLKLQYRELKVQVKAEMLYMNFKQIFDTLFTIYGQNSQKLHSSIFDDTAFINLEKHLTPTPLRKDIKHCIVVQKCLYNFLVFITPTLFKKNDIPLATNQIIQLKKLVGVDIFKKQGFIS